MMAFSLFEPSLKLTKPCPRELDWRCRLDSTDLAFSRQGPQKRFGRIQLPVGHQAANRANVTLNSRRWPRRCTLSADSARPCVHDLHNDMCAMTHTRQMPNPPADRVAVLDRAVQHDNMSMSQLLSQRRRERQRGPNRDKPRLTNSLRDERRHLHDRGICPDDGVADPDGSRLRDPGDPVGRCHR